MKPTAKSNAKPTAKATQPNRRAAAKKKKRIIISAIAAKIAEVSAISEEGVLILTIYDLTEDGEEYTFTDVKAVDFTNYAATEETEEYTIGSSDVIYTVDNKALIEIESTDLVVGDMLVLHEVSDDRTNLIAYHAQSEEEQQPGSGSA